MQTNLIYTSLLVAGLVLLRVAYRQYRRTRRLLNHGERATARVINMVKSKGSRRSARLPVFVWPRVNRKYPLPVMEAGAAHA